MNEAVDRIEPHNQYQIGAQVVLIRWGIITQVIGYRWTDIFGRNSELTGYKLSCGVTAPATAIEPLSPREPIESRRGT